MRASIIAHVAILAPVATAHLRLPVSGKVAFASPPSSSHGLGAALRANSLRYSANVEVGEPPQNISLLVSVDSDKSWVPDAESCADGTFIDECTGDSFDPSASSTYVESEFDRFSASFSDGTRAFGLAFEDTIHVGDTEVPRFSMGLATYGDNTQGELAISPSTMRMSYSLVEQLVEQGVTSSHAYSFSLDSEDASSGSILFGAVDTAAFEGPLQRISARPDESPFVGLPVDFSVLNYTRSSGGDPVAVAPQNDLPLILINPSDMMSNLPFGLAREIWQLAGASYNSPAGAATIPCSGGIGSASELILGLGVTGNATVRVSFDDLIIPLSAEGDEENCLFAIQSVSEQSSTAGDEYGAWSLGGVVLRNTYTVMDLVNDEVAFAPVKFTYGASRSGDIVPFSRFGAQIPGSEDADLDCSSSWSCRTGSSRRQDDDDDDFGVALIFIIIFGCALFVWGLVTLVCLLWYRGSCCFKGRRNRKIPSPEDPPVGSAMAEEAIYAGGPPPPLPPRPVLLAAPPVTQLPSIDQSAQVAGPSSAPAVPPAAQVVDRSVDSSEAPLAATSSSNPAVETPTVPANIPGPDATTTPAIPPAAQVVDHSVDSSEAPIEPAAPPAAQVVDHSVDSSEAPIAAASSSTPAVETPTVSENVTEPDVTTTAETTPVAATAAAEPTPRGSDG